MKRIILLLLVLTSFRFSYGEELSAEKQQLAWNLIYANLLPKDYLPNTFKSDIVINLKGKVTPEDSTVVKDIVRSFQTAIPSLKIELSDKHGTLILGINDGKKNTITSNMYEKQSIYLQEMYFPLSDSLSRSQRKQFIYYQLFRGLVFINKQQEVIPGIKGCVFAEKDFKKGTFSPLDLYILEKLYSPDFSELLVKNLDPELKQTAWNSIRAKFMGETN